MFNAKSKLAFLVNRPLAFLLGIAFGALVVTGVPKVSAAGDCDQSPTCHPNREYTLPSDIIPCFNKGCESAKYICCLE